MTAYIGTNQATFKQEPQSCLVNFPMQLAERTELGISLDSECALWTVNRSEAKCNMPKATASWLFLSPLCIYHQSK